jgi:hypothetical protein
MITYREIVFDKKISRYLTPISAAGDVYDSKTCMGHTWVTVHVDYVKKIKLVWIRDKQYSIIGIHTGIYRVLFTIELMNHFFFLHCHKCWRNFSSPSEISELFANIA